MNSLHGGLHTQMLRPTAVTADPAWLDTDANLSQAVVCISVCVSALLITHHYWDNAWKGYTFNNHSTPSNTYRHRHLPREAESAGSPQFCSTTCSGGQPLVTWCFTGWILYLASEHHPFFVNERTCSLYTLVPNWIVPCYWTTGPTVLTYQHPHQPYWAFSSAHSLPIPLRTGGWVGLNFTKVASRKTKPNTI